MMVLVVSGGSLLLIRLDVLYLLMRSELAACMMNLS